MPGRVRTLLTRLGRRYTATTTRTVPLVALSLIVPLCRPCDGGTIASLGPEATGAPQSSQAASLACPTTLRLESADGGDYLTAFESPIKTVASFSLHFYSYDTDYEIDLPNIAISTPYVGADQKAMYRSAAVDVHVDDTPPDGATIVAMISGAVQPCPLERVQIEPYGSIYHQKELEARGPSDKALDREMEALTTAVLAQRVPATKWPCEVPFTRPIVTKLEEPRFPDGVILNAEGTVFLSVWLDDASNVRHVTVLKSSGNKQLDEAAEFAAAQSKYRTETFGCKPQASRYIFRSTFSA